MQCRRQYRVHSVFLKIHFLYVILKLLELIRKYKYSKGLLLMNQETQGLSKQQIKSRETRAKIFQAAKRILQKQGYEQLSIKNICEEAGVLGGKYLDFDSFKARKAYVFDAPGHIGRIILQAPSKCKFTYKIHGKSAHAGNEPEKGINAIKAAAALIMQLPDNRQSPHTTTNISTIHAGTTSTNVVCDYAEILAEARSTDNAEFEEVLHKFAAPIKEIEEKYGVTIEYDENVMYYTFKIEPEEEIVQIALKAMQNLGIEPVLNAGGGGMDGNHFNRHGIKAIGIAPGYFKNHTPNEHIYIEDLISCGKLAAEIAWTLK